MKILKNIFYILITLIFVSIAGAIGRQCSKTYVDQRNTLAEVNENSEKEYPQNTIKEKEPTSPQSKKEEIQKQIQAFLKKSLPELPYKLDSGTECYKADLEYKHMIYFYRLFNTLKRDIDVDWARNKMQNQIIDYYCQSPRLKFFRNEDVKMTYHYVDKNYQFLFKVSADNRDCK